MENREHKNTKNGKVKEQQVRGKEGNTESMREKERSIPKEEEAEILPFICFECHVMCPTVSVGT
jgi:hypothetical protein